MVLNKAAPAIGVPAIIAAAQKIRDTLDKDKSTGWREKVQKWADGKKKLEALLNDPELSQDKLDIWASWATTELDPLYSKATVPFFLTFFQLLLQYLFSEYIHQHAQNAASAGDVGHHTPQSAKSSAVVLRAVEVAGTVCERTTISYVPGVEADTHSSPRPAHKKILYTQPWIGLLVNLLEDCLQSDIGARGVQSTICETLLEILAEGGEVPVKVLIKDDVLGYKRLGSMFRKAYSTSTLVPLLHIALLIVPSEQAKKEVRQAPLQQLVMNVGWDPSVTKSAFYALAKVSLPVQEDKIMACVNAFAEDEQHPFPRGYQIASLSIDGVDRLTSAKSKKYATQGRLILYIDKKELCFKLIDEDGEETESFDIARVASLANIQSSVDHFTMTYRKSEPIGEAMDIAFTVKTGQGEGLRLNLGKLSSLSQINDSPPQDDVAYQNSAEDYQPPYSLEEVVQEVTTLAKRQQEEATRDAGSQGQPSTTGITEQTSQGAGASQLSNAPAATGNDGDEEGLELPPSSQQLPVHEETATSRSKKKFGKPRGRASVSPTKLTAPEVDNQSEDETQRSPPPTSTKAKSLQAAAARAVKATPTSKSTTKGGFKPPAPKSKQPTLGSQIKPGGINGTSMVSTVPEKGSNKSKTIATKASVNTRRRGDSVAPASEGQALQNIQAAPKARRSPRKSLAVKPTLIDVKRRSLSPLPWSAEATKTASTTMSKQTTTRRHDEPATPLQSAERSPLASTNLLSPPQTAFKIPDPRNQVQKVNDAPAISSHSLGDSGGSLPALPDSDDHQHLPGGPSTTDGIQPSLLSSPAQMTSARVEERTKAENRIVRRLSKDAQSEPRSRAPSASPPPSQPTKNVPQPAAIGARTPVLDIGLTSSPQSDILAIDLDDASSLSEAGHEMLRHIMPEGQSLADPMPSTARNHAAFEEGTPMALKPIRASEPDNEYLATDGGMTRSGKSVFNKASSAHLTEEEEPTADSSRRTLQSSIKGGRSAAEGSNGVRPRKHARLSIPTVEDPEEDFEDEETRPAKKVKTSHRDSDVEGESKPKSKSSSRKRSSSNGGEQEVAVADKLPESKKARGNSSKEKAKERILTESEKAQKEVSLVLDQIAEFLGERWARRIELSSKQSRLARAEFGQLAKRVVEGMHKQSVSLLHDINAHHTSAMKGFGEFTKKEIDPMKKDFEKHHQVVQGLIDAAQNGAIEQKKALFE
ncbi:hypothetical protein IAU59_005180 [Kwoniella sp. CBS 9459]